jgi:hypothetical protein
MALPARALESETFVEEHLGRLEERAERLQVDVTDLKADIRRVDGKVDAVNTSTTALQGEVKDGFLALVGRISDTERAIRADFATSVSELRNELKMELRDVKAEVGQLRIELRTDFKTELGQLRTDFRAEAVQLRADFRTETGQIRTDFTAANVSLREEIRMLQRAGIAATVFLLTTFAGGYVLLSAQVSELQVAVKQIATERGAPDAAATVATQEAGEEAMPAQE